MNKKLLYKKKKKGEEEDSCFKVFFFKVQIQKFLESVSGDLFWFFQWVIFLYFFVCHYLLFRFVYWKTVTSSNLCRLASLCLQSSYSFYMPQCPLLPSAASSLKSKLCSELWVRWERNQSLRQPIDRSQCCKGIPLCPINQGESENWSTSSQPCHAMPSRRWGNDE